MTLFPVDLRLSRGKSAYVEIVPKRLPENGRPVVCILKASTVNLISFLLVDYVDQRLAGDQTADVFLDRTHHPTGILVGTPCNVRCDDDVFEFPKTMLFRQRLRIGDVYSGTRQSFFVDGLHQSGHIVNAAPADSDEIRVLLHQLEFIRTHHLMTLGGARNRKEDYVCLRIISSNSLGLTTRCRKGRNGLSSVKYDDPQFNTFDLFSHFLGNIIIWAPGHPPGIEAEVRKTLASVDPNLVVYGVDPYSKILAGDFQQANMIATLSMLFGVLGLVLAAVGLYGVMAYSVEQRTSEIGVRMALGADRARVVRMVLRGAFSQIGIGLGLGIPLAIAAGQLMTTQLFGVSPWDPRMLAIATLLLSAAALLASWIPAARAATVEPMVALRTE
jgi:FtsX-like permease family